MTGSNASRHRWRPFQRGCGTGEARIAKPSAAIAGYRHPARPNRFPVSSRDKARCPDHCHAMRRIIAVSVVLIVVLASAGSVLAIDWQTLARHQARLLGWVSAHPVIGASAYFAAYIVTAALSLPHAAIMTVAGGLLFGAGYGCALTVIGATIGATILQVSIRSAFPETMQRQRHLVPDSVRRRLESDGFSYLLALRLVPVFPFWIVNLDTAAVGMPVSVFWPATLIGIVPVSYVLSAIGAGVGTVLEAGRAPDLTTLYSPRILLPLTGLALLALLPTLRPLRSRAVPGCLEPPLR
jgi:uncharacterized membrane protein YdjX (TVP38/TMEM64 family)